MTLADEVREAAQTLREVSSGLAAALRIAAQRPKASAGVLSTFQEAESLSLTVDAVLDEAAPVLALLSEGGRVVGRVPPLGAEDAKVRNGFDSLGQILLTLLRKATDAVSDVAANQSQWLVSPLQARQCLEAMAIHHGQLKAIYGISHLANMIIDHVDVEESLFLDVMGDTPRPELEPRQWRSAINTEPLFGRFFGFHYAPEMRNFLLVVNIARGSITTAAAMTPDMSSPIVRNIAALGWGWVYSNMVILNNLGVTIDRASQIGADDARTRQGIEQVRAFMNLAEDPIVSGVSALASADVAVDFVFDILPSAGPAGAAASNEGTSEQEAASRPTVHSALQSLPAPVTPISARIMSYPGRPVDRAALRLAGKPQLFPTPARRSRSRPPGENEVGSSVGGSPAAGCSPTRGRADGAAAAVRLSSRDGGSRGGAPPKGPLESLGDVVRQMQEKLGAAAAAMREPGGDSNTGQAPQTLSDALAGAVDSSMLAIAIKNELVKLQSNVSSFLAPDHDKHASALIIHFHGGGFVSQSSAGHAVYLKEWAADVPDAVILSVDYKLAPENPYPAALNDCLYAYFWALENATALGTTAERVVLCGDSAGGNLAVAVALKARAHGLRVADGICLAYPALYVNVAWSPSRLLSFFDPLLPLSILDLCLRAYVPEGAHPHKDPFISPLVASPDALRALPPISLVAGALDPLLDDSVQFMHNLRRSGREGDTFRIMETLPHGFLNMVQVSRDARDACSFLSRHLADMLHVSTRRRGEVGRGGSGGGGGGGVGGGGGGRSTTAGGGGAATTPQVFDN